MTGHALVTGGGRGIGRACALDLARRGLAVTALARTGADLELLASEADAEGLEIATAIADVTDEAALEARVAEAETRVPLTALIASAGINRPGPVTDQKVEDFDAVIEVNVRGTYLACRAVGRLLHTAGRGGRMVLLSSQMGAVGYPGRVAYCASKHAVNGMTKALAVEWASAGITVNAVAPTFVHTPLTERALADPDFRAEVLARIPMGRIGEVEDVVGAVRYLVSDGAGFVTGDVLAVDGGWTAW